MQIQAYLFFNGRCEEAVDFYQRALGAKVEMLMRNKDSPEPVPPEMMGPHGENRIMHASLRVGDSMLMASDGSPGDAKTFEGFSLSLDAKDAKDAERLFNALSEGGKVTMPLAPTFWSPMFGMLKDKFGVGWMIGVAPSQA